MKDFKIKKETDFDEKRQRNRNQMPYNHIGYHDPTASIALSNVIRDENAKRRRWEVVVKCGCRKILQNM